MARYGNPRATVVRSRTLMQSLREIPLFRGLASERLKVLANSFVRREVRARDTLYEHGDPAAACFVLLAGTVQFSVRLGRQKVISGLAFPGEILGLEALQAGAVRPETATASSTVEFLEIDADFLRQFLVDNPDFQLDLLSEVISKLREKSEHAVQTGHYDAEQKIAAYLISHHHNGHAPPKPGTNSLSQAELADYLALTPETFCRKVSKFRQLGWISGRGNEYTVKQHEALQRLLER